MAVYQLTLFYSNLREHKVAVQNIRDDVKDISGNKWRVLSAGEQVCAIVFETDEPPERMKTRFRQYGTNELLFLLAELSSVTSGHLTGDAWQWLDSRLSRTR
jgi:hypothetical protein